MDANNRPIIKTPSTLRLITTSFLIVEIENSLREWRQSIRGDDPCQGKTSEPDGRTARHRLRCPAQSSPRENILTDYMRKIHISSAYSVSGLKPGKAPVDSV